MSDDCKLGFFISNAARDAKAQGGRVDEAVALTLKEAGIGRLAKLDRGDEPGLDLDGLCQTDFDPTDDSFI